MDFVLNIILGCDQSLINGVFDQIGNGLDAQLLTDVPTMDLDCAQGDIKGFGNVAGPLAAGQQAKNLNLTLAQNRMRRRLMGAVIM